MRRLEVSRGPDEVARRPRAARTPLEDSRHAGCEGPFKCQGPRGRISRHPCLQRGGLRPQTATGGLGRRETLVSGGLKGREGSCSFGLGVGLPVPASAAAGLRALAFPSAGSGLDATRPLAFGPHREAVSVPRVGSGGSAALWFEER